MKPWLTHELDHLKTHSLRRQAPPAHAVSASHIDLNGTLLLNFSSNDYLGLAQHPEVIAAAVDATQRWGAGSKASRLIGGTFALHDDLEHDIADWKGTEAALLFNSGYHANIGVIPSLAKEGDVILSDALNHASLIDGCRLSKAQLTVFAHNDMAELEKKLRDHRSHRHRLIVTESVFSMDGDLAPLSDILNLAERYDAWVYLDEAHGTGVLGDTGAGLVESLHIPSHKRERLIQMGTLGKALGSFGAYVAGSTLLKNYLINKSRSFIFTTALPPAALGAAKKAIELCRTNSTLRQRLWANIDLFKNRSTGLRLPTRLSSAIVPIIVGDTAQTLALCEKLKESGFFIQAIRPPTVPAGTSRLRLTFSAAHQESDIERLVDTLRKIIPND